MRFITTFSIVLLAVLNLNGRDIYVATNGPGGGSPVFGTWATAASNIEWAVNVGTNTDTIWISNGVYVLTNQVVVNSNIIISGNPGEQVVVNGNNSNRCFLFTNTVNQGGVLDNLFITQGYTNGVGGGVYMRYGTARNCIFSNNVCNGTNGGGLYMNNGTALIYNCTFIGNQALRGGGLWLDTMSTTLVDHCIFRTNLAGSLAGGVYINKGSNITVSSCDIICNVAADSFGGAYFAATRNQLITLCNIVSNVTVTNIVGGCGLYSGVMSNCSISYNIASNANGGIISSGATIQNCTIARNTSLTLAPVGAGGGGAGAWLGSTVESGCILQNCVVDGNVGSQGGGILAWYCTIRNCLIKNNVCIGGGSSNNQKGGGVFVRVAKTVISGCTIVSNYASGAAGGGGIHIFSTATGIVDNCIIYFNSSAGISSNWADDGSASSFSNCCFAPALSGVAINNSTNNITSDPQFVARETNDYHLGRNSPCINAGAIRDWMTVASDLDGYRRVDKFSGLVDMGCYEYIPNGVKYEIK